MNFDIANNVKQCSYCNRFKPKQNNINEKSSWPMALRPWERVHVDFFQIKSQYFFVVVDAFSRFPEVIMTKDMTSDTVKAILQSLFGRYGIPNVLVSDNGPAFIAQTFQQWLTSLHCKHITTPPYHPESNGLAERFVRTVKEQLKDTSADQYHEKICRFLLCYRTIPHSSTSISPANLMFNRSIRTAHNILAESEVWIKNSLEKEFKPASIVGDLGSVIKLVKKENGVITKRHKDQIKFNPVLLPADHVVPSNTRSPRPTRNRRPLVMVPTKKGGV